MGKIFQLDSRGLARIREEAHIHPTTRNLVHILVNEIEAQRRLAAEIRQQAERYAVDLRKLDIVVDAAKRKRQTWEAVDRCNLEFGWEYCSEKRQADDDAQEQLNNALDVLNTQFSQKANSDD